MNRPTSTALAALSLLSVTALTACGGSSDLATDKPEAGASASASTVEVPSPAEHLAATIVTKADTDGFQVEEPDDEYAFAKSADEVTVDKPVCAPLAYAMNQLPLGTPEADLTRLTSGPTDAPTELTKGVTFTYVTLASYAPGKAQSAFADARKAVDACGDGFTAEANSNESPYDSVTAEQVTPAGDESLGFTSTMTFRGLQHVLHGEVVRSSDVLAVYFSVDGMAITNSRPSDAKLSPTVVKAQNGKLEAGSGR
ncbi:hypothetical protein ACWF8U_03070 [Streptomyces olivaceus]|uniref:hypothetical protein n=1 Tax=Streptomyces olivaceus TaxID=47716 RepID=UPI001CCF0110|nr:hypothetical protein [Streptomyces olivaceus]MBZ6289857.1 hypothetical protein [Streptomyces olivaceus]MBZ6328245.1 hypothetical protein [Streptomyces olivaceus]